ncbi:hypothetical protein NX059_008332 [Plenodomus lindquistii]|nr:hypothetical protein NX059_008332 [Plenodomus lindquistii]
MTQPRTSVKIPLKGPLLIFVLGPPCAGKSTLCKALSTRYDLDHFSIGDEMRSLISSTPTGHAARIKPLFTAAELETYTKTVRAGTLGPVHQTPRYVKERVFPDDVDPKDVKILIDGFPRQVDRWEAFKECAGRTWRSETSVAVILTEDREIARARFVARGRAEDVFDKRYEDHEETIGDVVKAMRGDGVVAFELQSSESASVEDMLKRLQEKEEWLDIVGAPLKEGADCGLNSN